MKILVINAYAGSPNMGMVFRHYYLAEEWISKGHEVLIVAGTFSHLRRVNPNDRRDLFETNEKGVRYLWIKNDEYIGNGIGRAKNMLQYSLKLWNRSKEIVYHFNPDVVLASCTNPLDTYGAQKIAKLAKAPLIHEVRDLWPITLIELYGVSKWNPLSILMQIGENSMCRKSDYVVSVLPASEKHFLEHGLKKGHFQFIPNGIVEEEWENTCELPDEQRKVFSKLKEDGKFVICFFGSHTRSYALAELIDAVQKIEEENVAVVFVGKGNYKEKLIELAARKKSNNFVFLDPVEKKYIPNLLEQADALYVGGIKNNIFRFGVAMNKLFDSMMSGKPILYAVEAPNNYIEEYSAGISVEAENVDALIEGIKKLTGLSKEELTKMGKNGKNAVQNNFTYSIIAEKFIKLFEISVDKKK